MLSSGSAFYGYLSACTPYIIEHYSETEQEVKVKVATEE